MTPVPFFGDLDKSVADHLGENFHGDKVKFNFKSVASNGTRMELKNVRAPNGAITSEILFGRLCSCSDSDINYDLTAKMELTGKVTTTATVNNLADGLKVELNSSFNADTNKFADQTVSGALKYRNQQLALLTKLERHRLGKTIATASAVAAYQNFRFGGEAVFSNVPGETGKPSTSKTAYALATAYENRDYTLSVKSTECFNKLNIGFCHNVASNFSAGAELTHTLKEAVSFSVATRYNLDKESIFKTKLSSNGVLCLGYNTRMSNHLKIGVSSECNVVDMSKGVTIGAAFNYE